MAKYYGNIGFSTLIETKPDVWEEKWTIRKYKGDVSRNSRRLESSDKLNDNISINNEIRILADPYACQNFHAIKYVEYLGTKWKVSNVTVEYPRLILTLGGVYNAS